MIFSNASFRFGAVVLMGLAVPVSQVPAMVTTNVDFNTCYFARQSTESHKIEDEELTEEERTRVEMIRDKERISSPSMETIIALGTQSNEASPSRSQEKSRKQQKSEETEPAWHFQLRGEHILLGVLVLVALGVVLFGGRKR